MKNLLKKIITSIPLVDGLRHTHFYRSARNKAFRKHMKKQGVFYKSILGRSNKLIFDIGANVGDHAYIFAKLSDKVVCVEPDSTNTRILHKRFGKKVFIEQKAVSDEIGVADFHIETNGSAYNTLSNKWVNILEDKDLSRYGQSTKFGESEMVHTVTLDALISKHGEPDFIKIDVEGFEFNVVKGLSRPVTFLCIEANLPEFLEETMNIVEYLHQLDSRYEFNFGNEYEFYLDGYVKAGEMLQLLKNTSYRFLEVYAYLNTDDAKI